MLNFTFIEDFFGCALILWRIGVQFVVTFVGIVDVGGFLIEKCCLVFVGVVVQPLVCQFV